MSLNLQSTFYCMKDINIEDFNGIDVKIDYKPIIDKYAGECKQRIVDNARATIKGRGTYIKGWVAEKGKDYLNNYSVTVWNSTEWQLTHLLENGHLIVNKKGGAGWSAPRRHIRKGFNSVKNRFENEIKRVQLEIERK